MSDGVSVVICCHNSARRLPETLRRLAAQQVPDNIPWEVVVIDNASTDDTAETARRCWPTDPPAPLRVVTEPRLGVANARLRSFFEARHEIISFVDDDNWVGPDWIENAIDFFRHHPDASALGGPSRPVFEAAPPSWFKRVSGFLAIGEQHSFSGDITERSGTLLWTAGMSLRKGRALELVARGFGFFACGGSSLPLKTGEDTELCFALRAAGGRLYYDSKMAIEHFMPAERLVWPKILKLMRIMGEASPVIELYSIALEFVLFQGRPAWKKTWLFQFLKSARQIIRLFLLHPRDCLRRPEGSRPALDFENALGRMATLGALCGRYGKMRDEIRHAGWVQLNCRPR